MRSALYCVIALLVGVAIGYAVWHGEKNPDGGNLAGRGQSVQFVVLKGGGVFYSPQAGDTVSWYAEGTDPSGKPIPINVTFPDSPCSGHTGAYTAATCTIAAGLPPGGLYAYDCSSSNNIGATAITNVCEDPGISPGSKNGGQMMTPPTPDGRATTVTIAGACGSATVYPALRTTHIGDTVTWLSNGITWSTTLPASMCSKTANGNTDGKGSFDDKHNVCNVAQAGSASYNVTISGCPQTIKGKLTIIGDAAPLK